MTGKNHLKTVRIVFSAIIFISLVLVFIFSGFTLAFVPAGALALQFIPSLLKQLSAAGIISGIGFIIVIILTIVTGRIYCSSLCPLGFFFDIWGFASKKLRKRKKYRYIKPQPLVQLPVLAAVVISAFAGSLFLLSFLDPYSIFGRIAINVLKPPVIMLNNFLVRIFEHWDIYFFRQIAFHSAEIRIVLISILMFAGLGILAFFRGRWYCTAICPVGTVLGFLSTFSFFRIRLDRNACNSCRRCENICRSACIDSRSRLIDNSRCVRCFDCLSVCPQSALKFQSTGFSLTDQVTDTGKRRFIAAGITAAASAGIGLIVRPFLRPVQLQADEPVVPSAAGFPAVPPGAVSLDHYLSRCTACHLCVSVCPSRVIAVGAPVSGRPGLQMQMQPQLNMQPYMNYRKGFCGYECSKCSDICPTMALEHIGLEEKKLTRIGTVCLSTDKCIVKTKHENCGACAEHCPTHAVYTVKYGELNLPEIDTRFCIGCGACENVCPVQPYTAIFVRPLSVHEKALPPSLRKIETETIVPATGDEDFPF